MHCTTDPVLAHRELQRQMQSGALTPAEYRAAFRTVETGHAYPWCCQHPGCTKPAAVRVGGVAYCAPHWTEAHRA